MNKENGGATALHHAVKFQNHFFTRVLLKAGADPTLIDFQLHTPFHLAVNAASLTYV